LGKLAGEVSASPHDSRSIIRLAEAVDDLQERLGKLEGQVKTLEQRERKAKERS